MTSLIRPLKLRVCDDQNRPSIFINLYSELSYTERFGDRDSFTFSISRKAENVDYLVPGRVLIVPKDDSHDTMRALVIKQISADADTVTVSGCDYLWELFTYRLCLNGIQTGTGYDTMTGAAETLARHYIDVNIISATDTRRRDPNVTMETAHSPALGKTLTVNARLHSLQEILETICLTGGIGIEGVLVEDSSTQGWHVEIRMSEGTDRSQT